MDLSVGVQVRGGLNGENHEGDCVCGEIGMSNAAE